MYRNSLCIDNLLQKNSKKIIKFKLNFIKIKMSEYSRVASEKPKSLNKSLN
jgi:hypothetical protein